ncbi:amino acid ABC transporter substrate-binding protein [Frigoribacterium sp. CFBP 13605]|uniref:ABC transporter substrate-binding protein n=1 Tax=Frigoribacterium sp. CFBP 13605 TaxID=2774034 RepID=UPI001904C781|nr:ABC transporter substrate-binding protein [Frigoribacterium sp. CFBP 13605]MBD8141125.1 amino acid ABC transporter substrate-binding protein [Frigoribacterium sp. CFBP 13605]
MTRRTTTRLAAALAAVAALGLALTACSSGGAEAGASNELGTVSAGTLRIGTTGDTKPYAYTEDGELQGFDVEMAKEVAKRLGLETEFVTQEFSALLPAVANGQLDMAAASISDTEEREKTVDFSDHYFIGYISVLAADGSGITDDESSLDGKRLGIVQGTIQDSYAQENFTGAELVRFPDNNSAVAALGSGTIDAHFLDFPVAEEYAAASNGSQTIAINVAVPEFPVGFPIAKGNDALKTAVDGAVADIVADGTWLEIDQKFFPDQPVPDEFQPSE